VKDNIWQSGTFQDPLEAPVVEILRVRRGAYGGREHEVPVLVRAVSMVDLFLLALAVAFESFYHGLGELNTPSLAAFSLLFNATSSGLAHCSAHLQRTGVKVNISPLEP